MRKLFVERHALHLAYYYLGVFGYGYARKRGNGVRFLPHYLSVERAVDEYGFAYLFALFFV